METAQVNNWFDYASTGLLLVMLAFLLFRTQILTRMYQIRLMSVHQLAQRLKSTEPPLLVDVRTPGEWSTGYIRQSVSAPLAELRGRREEILRRGNGRDIVVICERGQRSLMGAVTFRRAGAATVYSVVGGISHWRGQGYPVLT